MSAKPNAIEAIAAQKMLPLFYHKDREVCLKVLESLYAAGIRVVEFTNRGDEAYPNFEFLKKKAVSEFPGLLLGIGTIKTPHVASSFIGIGADYIICPSVNPEVAKVTQQAGLQWIPGCMTPTEIALAEQTGAKMVKLFPGNLLGPGFVSSIKELFPDLLFMPTGGVEVEDNNLKAWFKAGVCAVGMGSKLVSKEIMESKDYSKLQELTRHAISMVKEVR
jgi:2-dehydro-3-deoxyphosphogluconate aldolase/(4S)-4-hydroxy-2-oxoglutarate aldolase